MTDREHTAACDAREGLFTCRCAEAASPAALPCLLAKFPGDECEMFAESPSEWCENCRKRQAASPAALDVERLSDNDIVMLKATLAKEEQRRYAARLAEQEPNDE